MTSRRQSVKEKEKDDEKTTDDKETCVKCRNKVETSHHALFCELCEKWFHIKCVNINKECYEALKVVSGSHWFCENCNIKVSDIIQSMIRTNEKLEQVIKKQYEYENTLAKAEVRQEMIENKLGEVAKEVNVIRQEMINLALKTDVEATVKKEIEEVKTVSLADIMKEELEKSIGSMTSEIQTVKCSLDKTKVEAEEQRDRESRRNNIILYKVPESKDARAEDRNNDDKAFCLRLFNKGMQVGISEEDFGRVFRLGKRGTDEAKPRPLLVQFEGYAQKNMVMESLFKLKHADTQLRSIVVAQDMTKAERQEIKNLVADAKVQEEEDMSGEYKYRVRGPPGKMKVVRIKIRQ